MVWHGIACYGMYDIVWISTVWYGMVWCGMVWPMSSLMVAALWQTRTWNSSSQLGYSESFTTCKDHGTKTDCCEPVKGGTILKPCPTCFRWYQMVLFCYFYSNMFYVSLAEILSYHACHDVPACSRRPHTYVYIHIYILYMCEIAHIYICNIVLVLYIAFITQFSQSFLPVNTYQKYLIVLL
jgi:hypothetical protein